MLPFRNTTIDLLNFVKNPTAKENRRGKAP
jgi:hypothetical protein